MAKKIRIVLTLQLPAGKATPAPPVGTALGPHGINIVEFTKSYNEKTADKAGQVIPAQITVYEDRSFTFVLKTPPAADLLRKAAGVAKGSQTQQLQALMTLGWSVLLLGESVGPATILAAVAGGMAARVGEPVARAGIDRE